MRTRMVPEDVLEKLARFFLIFVMAFLMVPLTNAADDGRIEGIVTDRSSKEPLAGVNIMVSGTNRGASTDLNGRFFIDKVPVGTYRLEFNYIGYMNQKISDVIVSHNKPAIVDVELTEQILESDKILVSAGYFVEETMTQPSTIGLRREEIRRFPGGFEDVVRTVSTLPGVAVNIAGGRNDLLVRGGGPSENLFIINNIEVPNINHFGTQGSSSGSLSFINLDFVEKVSFSTGGFSSEYGDKMSSALTLDMSRGRSDRIGGKLLISATQYGFNLEGPLDSNSDFIFSARQSYLDLIFKAAGLPFVPVYTDFNFLSHYDLSAKDKLFVLGLAAIDRVERDFSSEENRVKNAGIMDNTQNQFIAGMNYRRLLETGFLDLTANFNLYDFTFSQINEDGKEYFNSAAIESEIALKVQRFYAFSKQVGLTAGLTAKRINLDNATAFADTIYNRDGKKQVVSELGIPQFSEVKDVANKAAAFLKLDWLATPELTFNVGLRLDQYSFLNKKYYLAPRFNIKYKLDQQVSLKASAGIYYQSPSYVWIQNEQNRDLKALRNNMYILGLDYLIKDDLRMSLESFYKDYRDLPTGTVPEVNDYLIITNTGLGYGGNEDNFQSFGYFPMNSGAKGTAYGFEWLLQKKFSQVPCYGQISLTYTKSEYTAGNGQIYPGQYDQRIIFNISGGYKFNDSWEISTKYRFFTGIPYTPTYRPDNNPLNPGQSQNLPEEYLSARQDPEGIWDIRVDKYFNFDKWRLVLFLDIQNILNTKYQLRPRYDVWEDQVVSRNDLGILPSIGISAEF